MESDTKARARNMALAVTTAEINARLLSQEINSAKTLTRKAAKRLDHARAVLVLLETATKLARDLVTVLEVPT